MSCALDGTHVSSRQVAANCGLSRGVSDNLGDSSPNRIRQESGHRAAVVERDPPCVHIERLRARGCQVIVADASETATLDLAGVDRAAALIALTDSTPPTSASRSPAARGTRACRLSRA